jgi:hypothetical protein
LWGLASGAGFGISEGILYSENIYNGISGRDIYLIRFASCVALHAVWTASVGITLSRLHRYFQPLSVEAEVDRLTGTVTGVANVAPGLAFFNPFWGAQLGVTSLFFRWVWSNVPFVAVVMVLHGLYNTFLAQEMEVGALITALVSFGWLGWQIESRREQEKAQAATTPEPVPG